MALRYDAGMSFEERAALLTDRLLDLDQVKEWKHAVKVELARPECPVTSNAALESPVVVCLLDKMGLLGLLKRTVIDLHCEAMQTVAAEAKHKTNSAAESCRFLPETTTDGCNLDVVRAARDNWEKITSDEMLRLAKEMNRPLVALNTNVETVEITARTDGLLTGPEMEMKPSKRNKILATRFLYDGSDLLNSLQAIEPVNRARDTAGATEAWADL
ncbi:hypothetical protein PHYBOEH_001920 [Phytophthora boehmeriae]|uniref:Uncharacterized protein n=1 Tax=Phytophthora boehmeriae TaxID=109152 RepID=A0A8T1WU19_9STRA|nr:hypothetical protein PHYBOEH_001920 [Phytophthora boehmeriae]